MGSLALAIALLFAALLFAPAAARAQAATQLEQLDLQVQQLYNAIAAAHETSATFGADPAGHTLAPEVDALVMTRDTTARLQVLRKAAAQSSSGVNAASAVTAVYEATALVDHEDRQLKMLQQYFGLAPSLRYLRELWQKQLALAPTALAALGGERVAALVSTSEKKVAALEQQVWELRTQVPDDATTKAPLFAAEGALISAYNAERQAIQSLVATSAARSDADIATTPRVTACPAPAAAADPRAPTEPVKTVSMGDPAAFYPAAEEDRLAEGRVIVTLKIAPSGCMTHSGVNSSSGDAALDAGALRLVETGVFLPALRDGTPVEGYKSIAVKFQFNR